MFETPSDLKSPDQSNPTNQREHFQEQGVFYKGQFSELLDWIYDRNQYEITVHGNGNIYKEGRESKNLQDSSISIQFTGKVVHQPPTLTSGSTLLLYITEFIIENQLIHIPYMLSLNSFSHHGFSPVTKIRDFLVKLPLLGWFFRGWPVPRLLLETLTLNHDFTEPKFVSIGILKQQFAEAITFITRYGMDFDIHVLTIGYYNKNREKIAAILRGQILPSQPFKTMIIAETSLIVRDFLALNMDMISARSALKYRIRMLFQWLKGKLHSKSKSHPKKRNKITNNKYTSQDYFNEATKLLSTPDQGNMTPKDIIANQVIGESGSKSSSTAAVVDDTRTDSDAFLLDIMENVPIIKKHKRTSLHWFQPSVLYLEVGQSASKIQTIIEIRNLTVKFGKRTIIDNASFSIIKGSIIGIVGESGAGKSTTVKALLGEIPYSGQISIMGIDARQTKRLARYIGYVPQDLSLIYHEFNALENMIHFGRQYDLDEAYLTQKAKKILKDLNIAEMMEKPVSDLSGGQKRRVSIAMAMVHDPSILILDEPTSGLDPISRYSLWRFLDHINKLYGITMIVISHYLDEIEYSDKSAVYLKGIGFFDYANPEILKQKLPGKGKTLEVTLETVDLRAVEVLQEIPEISEIVQRGERIRILSEEDLHLVERKVLQTLARHEIGVYQVQNEIDVDMMDYFTIFSRKMGANSQFSH